MKRTISLKLILPQEYVELLLKTEQAFSDGCNAIVPFVIENRCWNSVALHHLSYYKIRKDIPNLGSQMVCNAIRKVCYSYKALKIKKGKEIPKINFKKSSSVHYCARTFSLKGKELSLFTVNGRIRCPFCLGQNHATYLEQGKIKEAELVRRGQCWFFNLVLDIPDIAIKSEGTIVAIDVGENNLATTSEGIMYGGGKLRHERDKFLARRSKLMSNGSRSAKRRFKKISGKEKSHVKQTNHVVSKLIVEEAVKANAKIVVMEDLTNIRTRIKAGKRLRTRLHRWAWKEFQQFIEYKAQAQGIQVVYVNPAYSSQVCSVCGCLGIRHKHLFKCSSCGSRQHSDRNACQNLLRLGESVVSPTATVNMPMVAGHLLATSFPL